MGKKSKSQKIPELPVSHNNGMKIEDIYRFKYDNVNYYVYEGLCNNIKTKWITKTKWDYKIKIAFNGIDIEYLDSKGDFITVLEKNDPNDIVKWNIFKNIKN